MLDSLEGKQRQNILGIWDVRDNTLRQNKQGIPNKPQCWNYTGFSAICLLQSALKITWEAFNIFSCFCRGRGAIQQHKVMRSIDWTLNGSKASDLFKRLTGGLSFKNIRSFYFLQKHQELLWYSTYNNISTV